jgi:hypothetical protein
LKGSCRCGAVGFELISHTPQPYQLCYCSICRKTAGAGGYAINLMGVADTLAVDGSEVLGLYSAEIADDEGRCSRSEAQRRFSAMWLYDPRWPDLVHPFASVIDSELPTPPERVHIMLEFKPTWVEASIGPNDRAFDRYPEETIEEWHKSRGLWVE